MNALVANEGIGNVLLAASSLDFNRLGQIAQTFVVVFLSDLGLGVLVSHHSFCLAAL